MKTPWGYPKIATPLTCANSGLPIVSARASADRAVNRASNALPPASSCTMTCPGASGDRAVTVTGNVGLAADLEYLFANLRWDVEADLSRLVGDIAAHRISRAGRAAAGVTGAFAQSLVRSSRQFLTEERPLLARPDEVSVFVDEIDHLRDDADRLESRVARLEAARRSRVPADR